jgi:UDPglucose 6-dehydrogenase
VVAVKSTVTPGTTAGLVRRAIEGTSGGRAGEDFGLAMNPEFLSQASAVRDFLDADRIVVGAWDRRSGDVLARLYAPFPAPFLRMGLEEAEMVKYAANGLQATMISYANQIASICEATPGVDHGRVMAAVHLDRRLAGPDGGRAGVTHFLMGGLGFGGSCFPKDLEALTSYARSVGIEPNLIQAVGAINAGRIDAALRLLEAGTGALRGKTVTVLGLTFKPGTDDIRESPGLRLARRLLGCDARVRVHDPLPMVRDRVRGLSPHIVVADTADAALAGADAAVVATAWEDYRRWDWRALAERMAAPIVLDGRNLLDGLDLPRRMRVLRAGVSPTLATAREQA